MFQRRTSGTHAHAQSWWRRTVKALGRWVGRGGGGGHGRRHHNLIAYDGLSSNTSNGLPWIKVPFACITSLRVDAHLPNPWNAMWEGVTRPGCSQQLPRSLPPEVSPAFGMGGSASMLTKVCSRPGVSFRLEDFLRLCQACLKEHDADPSESAAFSSALVEKEVANTSFNLPSYDRTLILELLTTCLSLLKMSGKRPPVKSS